MEIFLEFLKYGAIGIAMVLVVLSYRLLSKEQEKEHVREPMLKSIRNYFILAIVLTLFFGITEVVSLLIIPDSVEVDKTKMKLSEMFSRVLPEHPATKTEDQLRTIEKKIEEVKLLPSQEDLEKLEQESANTKTEMDLLLTEVSNTALYRLEDIVKNQEDHFINLDHLPEQKDEQYELLSVILKRLNQLEKGTQYNKSKILAAWCDFKKEYARIIPDINELFYIVKSDIRELRKRKF